MVDISLLSLTSCFAFGSSILSAVDVVGLMIPKRVHKVVSLSLTSQASASVTYASRACQLFPDQSRMALFRSARIEAPSFSILDVCIAGGRGIQASDVPSVLCMLMDSEET